MKSNAQYKQTEIGEIPEEWNVLAVEEFAEVIGGGTPSTKDSSYFGGDIPWITPKDLSTWTNKRISRGERSITEKGLNTSGLKLLPKNSVLLTSRAPVGYLAIADNAVATNQGFKSLIPKENADSDFVYYLLKSNVDKLKNNASGSTFQELSGGVLKKIKFALPELPEQQQIASILSSLDDKIELNRRMNKTLEEIGKALFKHWFVDFEFPNENGEPYKSSGGEMVESELGEIPRGWKVKTLSDIVSQLKPGTNYQPKRTDIGVPFVNVKNVKDNFLDLSESKLISEKDFVKVHKSWIPEAGDVLITRIGTLGNVAVIRENDLPLALHYNTIDIKKRFTSSQLLFFLLRSETFQREYHRRKKQTVQEYITIEAVETIPIIMPEIKHTLETLELPFIALFNQITANQNSIQSLASLRDSLLPRLMSGKIRV